VVANDWLVSLRTGSHEVVVFADGRIVVKGTCEVEEARALVASLWR